jgi:hypothetical protein
MIRSNQKIVQHIKYNSNMDTKYLETDLKNISIKNLNLDLISNELTAKGFYVCDDLIDLDIVNSISEYWKNFFLLLNHNKPKIKMVRGNLHLGEKNFSSYTNNHKWNLFRIFEFYWNPPESPQDKLTKDIAIELHRVKNFLIGNHPSQNLRYESNSNGAYLSVSHYPPNSGFMEFHSDAFMNDEKLYHFMVNLTFKGIDYSEGGLQLIVDNKKIDVDSLMKPGSVLFYDGSYEHGVEPVVSNNSLGRIAFFSIPAPFFAQTEIPNFLRLIEKVYFKITRAIKK